MAHVDLDGTNIRITSEFREKELVKTVPGTRWDNAAGVWRCSLSWASCVALRGTFGDALSVGPELAEWARAERESRVRPCLALRVAEALDANHLIAKRLDELAL